MLRLQTLDLCTFYTKLVEGITDFDYTELVPKEKLTQPSEGKFNRIGDIFYDNQENDYILEE